MEPVILVAEDDEVIYESIQLTLAKEGFQTIHAPNGLKAINYYKQHPVPVVLTDLRMPDMDGYELVNQLLSLEEPPIILIQSVVDDLQLIISLMRRGVHDYLIKPYSFQELLIRIKKAFELLELKNIKKQLNQKLSSYSKNYYIHSLENLERVLNKITSMNNTKEGVFLNRECFLALKEHYKASSGIFHELEKLYLYDYTPNSEDYISIKDFILFLENILIDFMELSLLKKQHLELHTELNLEIGEYFLEIEKSNFQYALKELILNSMKFGSSESIIKLFLKSKNKCLILRLENEISKNFKLPTAINLIFEPFYQAQTTTSFFYPSPNLGLGLTIARRIILSHYGTIKCNKQTKQDRDYLSFKILLPIHKKSFE
jgi:CheY-like chemotaxis protein